MADGNGGDEWLLAGGDEPLFVGDEVGMVHRQALAESQDGVTQSDVAFPADRRLAGAAG
jgi:hypothetical protein